MREKVRRSFRLGWHTMIRNSEVTNMLLLVGIDPANVPARQSHTAAKHMNILARYVGYKAGLDASRQSRPDYDLDKEAPAILGDFIEIRLTFKPIDPMDRSLFDGMRRMLALVEGATGYPMTTERMEKKAFICFLKAVLDDIAKLKADREDTPVAGLEELPKTRVPSV